MKNQAQVSSNASQSTPIRNLVYIAVCLMGFFLTQQVAIGQDRFYFDIKKGASVEGDVSLSSGALRASDGSYVMRLDGANVLLGNPRDFRLNGYIKNTRAQRENQLREINFDQYYGSESPNGRVDVAQATTFTLISIKNVACHVSYKRYYDVGYRVEANITLKIYNNGRGEFSIQVTKIKSIYNVNPGSANPPSLSLGTIAEGATISPTIMTAGRR